MSVLKIYDIWANLHSHKYLIFSCEKQSRVYNVGTGVSVRRGLHMERTSKFSGGRIDPGINSIDSGVGIGTVATLTGWDQYEPPPRPCFMRE